MKTGIVLIHGAGLGGWIWRDVIKNLDFPYLTVNFPFRSNDAEIENLRLSDYCAEVYQQVMKWDEVEKYVVIGHSIGSIPAIHLTKRQSDRVKGFVAVSSLLPGQGESFVSQLPFVKRVMLTTIIKLKGTKPPESIIKSLLCNDLKDDTAEMVAKSYVSESPYLFFDPSTYDLPTVPSLYIQTTRDQDTPPDLQQRMAEKLDNCSIDTIDTGHLPMLSKPDRLSMQFENFTKLL